MFCPSFLPLLLPFSSPFFLFLPFFFSLFSFPPSLSSLLFSPSFFSFFLSFSSLSSSFPSLFFFPFPSPLPFFPSLLLFLSLFLLSFFPLFPSFSFLLSFLFFFSFGRFSCFFFLGRKTLTAVQDANSSTAVAIRSDFPRKRKITVARAPTLDYILLHFRLCVKARGLFSVFFHSQFLRTLVPILFL